MRLSARNVIKGTVLEVREGPVNSRIKVDIGGGNAITSMITADAAQELGLAVGAEVHVVIKASDVMLAAD